MTIIIRDNDKVHRFNCDAEEIEILLRSKEPEQPLLTDARISDKELEILKLTAQGKYAKEIGKEVYLSERTVESIKHKLMCRLGYKNQMEMIVDLLRKGIIQ